MNTFNSIAPAPSCLDRGPHDHGATARTGNRAFDEQQLASGIDSSNHEILRSAANSAQVPGHALAWHDAARILPHADGTRRIGGYRVAMRSAVGRKMMALDRAGESLADGHPGDVDLLADPEKINAKRGTRRKLAFVVGCQAKLVQPLRAVCPSLAQMTRQGFGDPGNLALAGGDLDGAVTVVLDRSYLGHPVVGDIDHRHRHRFAVIGEDSRHADLASEQAQRRLHVRRHCYLQPGCDWPGM
ncbi:hypothetical protein SBBP2_920010 [Burkholderiales bacterium]|nr:hypothetical protein SBBP2_920010 [Burkholderiales bacterium]